MSKLPYIFLNHAAGRIGDVVELAVGLEERGFAGVFSSGTPGDNVALSLLLLERTRSMVVGTGIAGIYHRHVHTMATAAGMIEEVHPGRFMLGLGVTHTPWLKEMDLPHGKPLSDMRAYIAAIREITAGGACPPVLVAALRQRMTALAGEVGDGVMWANAALSHIGASMAALPDSRPAGFVLGNSVPVCVSDNEDEALAAIRKYLLFYIKLEHYRNYWVEAGFAEDVEAAAYALERGDDAAAMTSISDRLARDVGLVGSPHEIRLGIERWKSAGITHLILDPVSTRTSNLLDATDEVFALAD